MGEASNRCLDEVLDLVDLRARAHDTYRPYSLGMEQRLSIGAALLADPELILLDEPTNGLDPAGVHAIRELILRLAHLGKTVFLASHLLYEVQQVRNRVAHSAQRVFTQAGQRPGTAPPRAGRGAYADSGGDRASLHAPPAGSGTRSLDHDGKEGDSAQVAPVLPFLFISVVRHDGRYIEDHTGQTQTPAQSLWRMSGRLYPR